MTNTKTTARELIEKLNLPPQNTIRWVVSRKYDVINAVKNSLISKNCVLDFYNLTSDEFKSWVDMFDKHGKNGLRTTRTGHYRKNHLR